MNGSRCCRVGLLAMAVALGALAPLDAAAQARDLFSRLSVAASEPALSQEPTAANRIMEPASGAA